MINSYLNDYYIHHINSILTILKHSQNGKRIWTEDDYGYKDYSQSTETNYPEWAKFYYIKTPTNLRYKYCEVGVEAWKDGYFNGSNARLHKMFENSLNGKLPRSDRMLEVFDRMVFGYFEELKEIELLEEQFNESLSFNTQ